MLGTPVKGELTMAKLSRERELDLARRMAEHPEARQELILAQSGLVYSLARKICERRNRRDLLDDLSSAGAEALIKAVDSFDPDRAEGASLFTYAYRKILGAMTDYLREERYSGVHVVRNDREIAYKNLGISSLDDPTQKGESPLNLRVTDPAQANNLLPAALRRALANLSKEEQRVFLLRGIEEQPYEEISVRSGIPEGTLKSLYSRAKAKLRNDPSLIQAAATYRIGGNENE